MQLSKDEVTWINGEKVRPYQFKTSVFHGEEPLSLRYRYVVESSDGSRLWERDPNRTVEIIDPINYQGELGIQGNNVWRNPEACYIVNGHVEIANTNFVSGLNYSKIGKTNLMIGPYPESEYDIKMMK